MMYFAANAYILNGMHGGKTQLRRNTVDLVGRTTATSLNIKVRGASQRRSSWCRPSTRAAPRLGPQDNSVRG